MAWEYSEKTKKLSLDAVQGKPGTHLGEVENPDGLGEHGSIACMVETILKERVDQGIRIIQVESGRRDS